MLVKRMDFQREALGEDIKAPDITVGPFMAAIIALLPRGRTSFASHPRDDLRATEPPTQPLGSLLGPLCYCTAADLHSSRMVPMQISLSTSTQDKTAVANIYSTVF